MLFLSLLLAFTALVSASPTLLTPDLTSFLNKTAISIGDANLFNKPTASHLLPPAHLAARGLALPDCSRTCWENNYNLVNSCNGDATCICSAPAFIAQVTCCVSASCGAADQLATFRYTKKGVCKAAGVKHFRSELVKQLRNSIKKLAGKKIAETACPEIADQVVNDGYA